MAKRLPERKDAFLLAATAQAPAASVIDRHDAPRLASSGRVASARDTKIGGSGSLPSSRDEMLRTQVLPQQTQAPETA